MKLLTRLKHSLRAMVQFFIFSLCIDDRFFFFFWFGPFLNYKYIYNGCH